MKHGICGGSPGLQHPGHACGDNFSKSGPQRASNSLQHDMAAGIGAETADCPIA